MADAGALERGLVLGYGRSSVDRVDAAVNALASCLADAGAVPGSRIRQASSS
jgi:hypothetical protein